MLLSFALSAVLYSGLWQFLTGLTWVRYALLGLLMPISTYCAVRNIVVAIKRLIC